MNNDEILVNRNDLKKLFIAAVSACQQNCKYLKDPTIITEESLEKQVVELYEAYKNFIIDFNEEYKQLKK